MDRADRKIVAEITHTLGVLLVHVEHELYLLAHKQREGLTEKEYKFLMARIEGIKAEREKLGKLPPRLRHHG